MSENVSKNNNMKTVSDIMNIIHKKYTYIPLLQRNYKWSRECASELAEDLWTAYKEKRPVYQLNMITIYNNEKDNSLQILDGQQRLITLKLFLAILEPDNSDLNYDFERDNKIDERSGRRYFINHTLRKDFQIQNTEELSVDVTRLWANYLAMIIPVSFRTIYEVYCKQLEDSLANSNATDEFQTKLKTKINTKIKENLEIYGQERDKISFGDEEINEILKLCKEFQNNFSNNKKNEEVSNDEIRESDISDRFQSIWQDKLDAMYNEKGGYYSIITSNKENMKNLYYYVLNNVEMLYHETFSEPIDEFLNINQNKTRFVISDYIRALMISDNPVDGDDNTINKKNKENRGEVLKCFEEISTILYSKKYSEIWDIVKIRYDDFDKNPDINRMKVVFCDKYMGTSTKGYEFKSEYKRMKYFESILKDLAEELGLEEDESNIVWNTYNAVKMLLECKKDYRFFSLFLPNDIQEQNELKDVTARERFCFFEEAYKKASSNSKEPWDISYFLESQLYDGKCEVKKSMKLPKFNEFNEEWCYVNRGKDNGELKTLIKTIISKKRGDNIVNS